MIIYICEWELSQDKINMTHSRRDCLLHETKTANVIRDIWLK